MSSDEQWHCMDDSCVDEVPLRSVLSKNAYLLFYVRNEPKVPYRSPPSSPKPKSASPFAYSSNYLSRSSSKLFDNTSQTQQHNASEWIGGESNLFKLSNLLFKNIKSNDKDNKVSKEQLKDIVSTANNNYCTNLWQCFGECVFIFLRKKMCECNEKHLSNALLCVVDKTKQEEKKLRNEQNESELINKKRSDY
ncbi:hypothetical protein RFI_15164, partial [Reticulomyxa filosa]